jgi:hypothetical protein
MLRRMKLRFHMGVVLSLGTAVVIACGGSSTDNGFGSSGGTSGGTSGATSGGTNGSSSFGGTSGGEGGTSGSSGSDSGSCVAPVDMFVMFDRSGSMGADCKLGDTTASKWCRSINALSGYFKSAGSMDQAAAIQFFPLDNGSDALCTTGDLYNVAALPTTDYQTLPSPGFDALLNSTSPNQGGGTGGGTPTEAAIRGLTRFTAANRRPGHVTIGVLITDGDPNGCDENLSHLSALLEAHHTATTIRTYVIGMQGATFKNLEQIAQGGNGPLHGDAVGTITDACGDGAGPCRHWNVADGDPTVFTAALAAIQQSADGCKPGGGTVNPPK